MRTFKRFKSFFSSEENGPNMKCVAHNDSELIRCYTLDRAGIMFDTLISPIPHRNAIAPEMDVINTLTT